MAFWKKLFGRKKPAGAEAEDAPKKRKTLKIADAERFLSESTKPEIKAIEKEAMSRLAEIKHNLKELSAQVSELKQKKLETDEGNKRMRKIIATSRLELVAGMERLAEKLKPPETSNYSALKAYSLASLPFLQKEINAYGRNIAYTGILLKAEISHIGVIISELSTSFSSLAELFRRSSLADAESARHLLSAFNAKSSEINESAERATALQKEIAALKAAKQSAANNVSELENSPEFSALQAMLGEKSKLIHEKSSAKERIIELLAPVEKPLRKLQNLARNGQYVLEASQPEALNAYISNPFTALDSDKDAGILKSLLAELKKLIADGKIALKEKETEKKVSAIEQLLSSNSLESAFLAYCEISAKISEIESAIPKSRISSSISSAGERLRNIEREITAKAYSLEQEKTRQAEAEKELSALKEALRQAVGKATNSEIELLD